MSVGNFRSAKYLDGGEAIDDPNAVQSLSATQLLALRAAASGDSLSITLDGSNRMATMTNNVSGRVATTVYTDSTHLTVSDNRTPQAVGTLVLDAGGRLVNYSGNF